MITTGRGFKKAELTDNADLTVFINDNIDNIETELNTGFVDINRYGFLNQTGTTISFDGTDTFTLAPKSPATTWSYYRAGIKYTITGSKTKVLATPMVNNTKYYVYIDATDGTLSSSTVAWTLGDTKVPVAIVYWNSTLTPKYTLAEERHTCLIDRKAHQYLHNTQGTRWTSGGAITGLVAGSTTPANKTFALSDTYIADEDITIKLSSLSDPDGATNTYYVVYRTDNNSPAKYDWVISDMPFKYTTSAGPTYGFIEYDNAGTMTASAANRYVNTYVIATDVVSNSEADPNISTNAMRYFIIPGKGSFNSSALAYAEDFSTFDLSGLPTSEIVAMYQLTWFTSNHNNTIKGRCELNRLPVKIAGNFISSSVSVADNTAETTNTIGALINSATEKTVPVDADMFALMDSEASNILKKFSFAYLKSVLKTYFDSLTTTFTNKRINKRVVSITSNATPAIDVDATDIYDITALGVAITSMTSGLTGTPVNGQLILIRIKDDGTARAISWGSSFVAGGVALPTTTVLGKILMVGFMYNTANSLNKWMCIASAQEA